MQGLYAGKITLNQALYLSDTLVVSEGADRDLMLKVLSVVSAGTEQPVSFLAEELWIIHAVAKSYATVGMDSVGMNLLGMCAVGLLELSSANIIQEAVDEVGESGCVDRSYKEAVGGGA